MLNFDAVYISAREGRWDALDRETVHPLRRLCVVARECKAS